jgi:hypothetical protein
MEYLYPPLVDITNTPKEEVIKIVRVNTIEKRYKNNEMCKKDYDEKLDRAKKGIKEPDIVYAPIEEPIEPIEEPQEEPTEPIKDKEDK